MTFLDALRPMMVPSSNYLAVSKVSVGLLSPYIVEKSSPYIVKKGVTLYSGKEKKKTVIYSKKACVIMSRHITHVGALL